MSKVTSKMQGPKPPQPGGTVPLPKSKRGIKGFFVEVGREMKKVSWPKPNEVNRMTGIVLAVCTLVVLILTGMGIVIDTLLRILQGGTV